MAFCCPSSSSSSNSGDSSRPSDREEALQLRLEQMRRERESELKQISRLVAEANPSAAAPSSSSNGQSAVQQMLQQRLPPSSTGLPPPPPPPSATATEIRVEVVGLNELRPLVSGGLDGAFRARLDRDLRARAAALPDGGRRAQTAVQHLPPSGVQRNDFSHLGIYRQEGEGFGGDDLLAEDAASSSAEEVLSVVSTAAANAAVAHSTAAVNRQLHSVQRELTDLRRTLRLLLGNQLETQRMIRQEVSAALQATGIAQPSVALPTMSQQPQPPAASVAGACLICLSSQADTVMYRCGHLCLCSMCTARMKEAAPGGRMSCPVCRAPVVDTVRMQVASKEAAVRCAEELLMSLHNPSTRDSALAELSKHRDAIPELACLIWQSYGCVAILLEEIVSAYQHLSTGALCSYQIGYATPWPCCSVWLHTQPLRAVLDLQLVHYLFPFLSNHPQHQPADPRPAEFLRLTALGVIGALAKSEDPQAVECLLRTEQLVPLCLRVMDFGSELSRTVATFVVQKVLQDPAGLAYVCNTYQRFEQVAAGLAGVLVYLRVNPSARLLKHVVRCYVLLTDNFRARQALSLYLPQELKDDSLLSRMQLQLRDRKTLLGVLHLRRLAERVEQPWPPVPLRPGAAAVAPLPASAAHGAC
uniref:CCR4-NOT transcription complex subunit 9 n=1 Tax=Macrostomum lignano TaxID=282301 RepID=A0A1I8J2F1_9PLAT